MKRAKNWVDYREVKERVRMEDVLRHYGLLGEMKKKGASLTGCCPIHGGTNPGQFVVHTERNIFNCFGDCKSGGNVLDFIAKMEGVPIHKAALLARDWFLLGGPAGKGGENKAPSKAPKGGGKNEAPSEAPRKREGKRKEPGKEEAAERPEESEAEEGTRANPPLTFELKSLKRDHPFFSEKGIAPATIRYFGLGFCSRGVMRGRIAIPIHNERGELVAYCGRAVDEAQAEQRGKYKLPARFAKSAVVYNLNRQREGGRELVLVESYLSVWRLYECGIPQAVALLGSAMSQDQERLIAGYLGPEGRALLCFDDDESGEGCARDCLKRLSPRLFVKLIDVGRYAPKPHHLEKNQVQALFGPA